MSGRAFFQPLRIANKTTLAAAAGTISDFLTYKLVRGHYKGIFAMGMVVINGAI
jgi:hypothetical protein